MQLHLRGQSVVSSCR